MPLDILPGVSTAPLMVTEYPIVLDRTVNGFTTTCNSAYGSCPVESCIIISAYTILLHFGVYV